MKILARAKRNGLARSKASKPQHFAGMSYASLVKKAAANRPPQRWFDEDHTGLRTPAK